MKRLLLFFSITSMFLAGCSTTSKTTTSPQQLTPAQIAQDSIVAGFDTLTLVESTALNLAMQGKISTVQLKEIDSHVVQAQEILNSALLLLPSQPEAAKNAVTQASNIVEPDQKLLTIKK